MEKQLSKTIWVKEARIILEYIPEEDLTKTQKKVLQKCAGKEELSEAQFKELKKILAKYRGILQKLKPDEIIENVEETYELIQNEQEFLDLIYKKKYLKMRLPWNDGNYEFKFEILPIKDSRVVESLEINVDLFKEFDIEEATTYSKAFNKKPEDLTEEEKSVLQNVTKKINELVGEKKMDSVHKILAHQLRLCGSNADYETRLEFWDRFHFYAKFAVYIEVINRLGLTEISNEKLFPFSE